MTALRGVIICIAALSCVGCAGRYLRNITPYSYGSDSLAVNVSSNYSQYSIPTLSSHPQGIATGSDGNLWFVESSGNKIGRISPSGVITEFKIPTASSYPISITSGSSGTLWFTENAGNAIGRITTNGVITEYHVPTLASHPYGIVYGPDKNIWFTESSANKIARFSNGLFTQFAVPTAGSSPFGICIGPDNNMWFAENGVPYVGRITTSGSITQINSGGPSRFIATAGDGAIWFTDAKDSRIGRITHFTRLQTFPLTVGANPAFIATGADGNAWFSDFSANDVKFVDATTHAVLSSGVTLPASSSPNGITKGPDGNIWITEYTSNKIGVIHPQPRSPLITTVPNIQVGSLQITVGPEGAVYENNAQAIKYLTGQFVYTTPYTDPLCNSSPRPYSLQCPDHDSGGIAVAPSGQAYWGYAYQDMSARFYGGIEVGANGGQASSDYGLSGPASYIYIDPNSNMWASYEDPACDNLEIINLNTQHTTQASCTDFIGTLAWGPGNTVWATDLSNTSYAIAKLTASGTIANRYVVASSDIEGLVLGTDGALWFTDRSNNKIGRITSSGTITEYALPRANSNPGAITSGYDGALWFTESGANRIGRITTTGIISEFTLPTGLSSPYGIGVPPPGANCTLCPIWFSYGSGFAYITY